jgi:hypothetical protein
MNKLQAGIMNMNFQKTAKRFIILSLIIVILGGVLTGSCPHANRRGYHISSNL